MYMNQQTQHYNIYEMMRSPDLLPTPGPIPPMVSFYGGDYNKNSHQSVNHPDRQQRDQERREQQRRDKNAENNLTRRTTNGVGGLLKKLIGG